MAKWIKPHLWWAITYVNCDDVMPDTIRRTRREAQKAATEQRQRSAPDTPWEYEWRQWSKRGCRAVRVVVSPP